MGKSFGDPHSAARWLLAVNSMSYARSANSPGHSWLPPTVDLANGSGGQGEHHVGRGQSGVSPCKARGAMKGPTGT